MSGRGPLVVTARLPAGLYSQVEGLRRAHYPPERNHVPAHVTLFHALPPSSLDEVRRLLAAAAGVWAPVPAETCGLVDLGTGTAVGLASRALVALRADLAGALHGLLGLQDEAAPRFHITLQNKVTRSQARALQAALAGRFEGQRFAFAGLELHRLVALPEGGGRWDTLAQWSFHGRQ